MHTLTNQQIETFRQQGYLGPFEAMTPDQMLPIRQQIISEILTSASPFKADSQQSRHLDCRLVFDLCSHPAIVQRVACIYGPDLLLWRSHFFNKERGAAEVPWHQDLHYWPLEPMITISAWLALDEATVENACVQIVPGAHKQVIPHVKAPPEMLFRQMADPNYISTQPVIDMELQPGQFFLFNEQTLHHSAANTSNYRRIGLATGHSSISHGLPSATV